LPHRYRISQDEAVERLKRSQQIIHVYGDLGPLPEFYRTRRHDCPSPRPYGEGRRKGLAARAASQNIHLVRDGATPQTFEPAKRLIAAAERVVILGFGFDRTNAVRLGLHDLIEKFETRVDATLYELFPVDEDAIRKEYTRRTGGKTSTFRWHNGDAMRFFTHVGLR
jgi:hypothetical protein